MILSLKISKFRDNVSSRAFHSRKWYNTGASASTGLPFVRPMAKERNSPQFVPERNSHNERSTPSAVVPAGRRQTPEDLVAAVVVVVQQHPVGRVVPEIVCFGHHLRRRPVAVPMPIPGLVSCSPCKPKRV